MKTQNGWPVLANTSPGSLNRQPFPGTKVVPAPGVRPGDVATVLHYVGSQFDKRVQKLVLGWSWGWAPATPIPGSSTLSNHGSGTAIDLNAPNFPWKRRTMTAAQRNACIAIAKECAPVVAWGGVWNTVDEMHFEINGTAAQVRAVADRLKGATAPKGDSMQITRGISIRLNRVAWYHGGSRPTEAEINRYVGKDIGTVLSQIRGTTQFAKQRTAVSNYDKTLAERNELKNKLTAANKAITTLEEQVKTLGEEPKATTIEVGQDTRSWVEKIINIFRS